MARTRRSVPQTKRSLDVPCWRRPQMTIAERYERGLFSHEISTEVRAGRFDKWDTTRTGGRSTRRIKQVAGKQRRAHEKRATREEIHDG